MTPPKAPVDARILVVAARANYLDGATLPYLATLRTSLLAWVRAVEEAIAVYAASAETHERAGAAK